MLKNLAQGYVKVNCEHHVKLVNCT